MAGVCRLQYQYGIGLRSVPRPVRCAKAECGRNR
jgi:hypothetical protein